MDGKVGIGTTSPLVKLQVYGNPMPATGDAASVEDIFTLYRNGSASVWSGGASLALGVDIVSSQVMVLLSKSRLEEL